MDFLGLLTFSGEEVPSDVYVWIIVLVLSVNSALNPVLYTMIAVIRQKVRFYSLWLKSWIFRVPFIIYCTVYYGGYSSSEFGVFKSSIPSVCVHILFIYESSWVYSAIDKPFTFTLKLKLCIKNFMIVKMFIYFHNNVAFLSCECPFYDYFYFILMNYQLFAPSGPFIV